MSTDIVIQQPETKEHENTGSIAVQDANQAVIESNADREIAASVVSQLATFIQAIELQFDGTPADPGPTRIADRAHKSVVALRDKALKGFKEAKFIWTTKIRGFEYRVEQARIAEARAAEEKARAEAEAKRKAEIEAAKKLGDKETVKQLKQAPLSVQAQAPITPEVTKAEGVRRSSPQWAWECVNGMAVPREYLQLDTQAITAIVKRLGPNANIPGITVYDARSRG